MDAPTMQGVCHTKRFILHSELRTKKSLIFNKKFAYLAANLDDCQISDAFVLYKRLFVAYLAVIKILLPNKRFVLVS